MGTSYGILYSLLLILVLLSHQARLIFRSHNHMEYSNGNCEDNLQEGCLWPDFYCSYILSDPYGDYMTFILFYRTGYKP
jgi:hypothetical protein